VFPDLMGLCEVGSRRVEWSLLFDIPGLVPAQRAKPIDGQLPRSLIELPIWRLSLIGSRGCGGTRPSAFSFATSWCR
jgi:hypothetical protein